MSEEGSARHRRPRVGDETQARIDGIADGWGKPSDDDKPPKPRAKPPPPPSSAESGGSAAISKPRPKATSAPPPIPGKRPPPPPPGAKTPLPKAKTPPPRAKTPSPEPTPEIPETRAEGSPAPIRIEATSPDDDDPTIVPTGDEPEVRRELRTPAALPRSPGLWGDMRYLFTVVFGLRRIRVGLTETEAEIEAEKRSRDKQLAELARLAIADEKVSTPVVEEAREQLVELEGARSKKAGAAAAVEEAIGALQRERDKIAAEREKKVAALEAQVAEVTGEIEPLEKQRAEVNREIREFKLKLDDYDRKIDAEELKLASGDAEAVEAEATIASLRADRETLAADEPALAEKLADIEPRLRELKARRGDLNKSINKLRRAEDESVVRSEERIAAARAHKLVVDRAAADMSREQNQLLTELGQKLYDRPPPGIAPLTLQLKETTVTLARLKDRATALAEERASVERWPLVRGALIWLLILGALGTAVYFALALELI